MYPQESEDPVKASPYKEIFPTAAAMLWQDRKLIAALYGLLVITSLILLVIPTPGKAAFFAFGVFDRCLQLLFTLIVTVRWIARVSQTPRAVTRDAIGRYYLFGVGIWCLFTVPLGMAGVSESPALVTSSFFLLGAAIWLSLRYFFYPLPILLGRAPLGSALAIAADISRGERALPIKLLVAPSGFLSLVLGIVMVFSPDGRAPWTNFAAEFVAGIFWVFATYLALAASLLRLDERIWREEGLDPYRTARLSTLEFQGSSWLAKQLRPAHGIGWMLVSVLVWTGNLVRMMSLPPAGTTTITQVSVDGPIVTVVLHLTDPEYRFNGFQPLYFSLAGEQYAIIAKSPESARVHGQPDGENALMRVPQNRTELDLELKFKANRAGKDISALQDLYLWYRSAKLDKITIDEKNVRETEPTPTPAAARTDRPLPRS